MNQYELTTLITVVANLLSYNLSSEDIALVSTIFVQLGDTLATIATQRSIYDASFDES